MTVRRFTLSVKTTKILSLASLFWAALVTSFLIASAAKAQTLSEVFTEVPEDTEGYVYSFGQMCGPIAEESIMAAKTGFTLVRQVELTEKSIVSRLYYNKVRNQYMVTMNTTKVPNLSCILFISTPTNGA